MLNGDKMPQKWTFGHTWSGCDLDLRPFDLRMQSLRRFQV